MMMMLLNQKQKHHMKEKKVYNFDIKQGCMYVFDDNVDNVEID